VVLCPGVNDGQQLEKTINDLEALVGAGLKPAPTSVAPAPAPIANKPASTPIANTPAPTPIVESVALVPVGMSMRLEDSLASRPGPWPLARYTPEQSLSLVKWALPHQDEFRRTTGKTFLHLSDESYLLAGWPLPEASQYDGFPQYQNGVGMARTLLDDWERLENKVRARMDAGWQPDPRRLVALCGTLIAPVLEDLGRRLTAITGREFVVVPVVNSLMGPRVSVSGLLAGRDFASALPPLKDGDVVLVPRRAVEASGRFFLDNLSVQRLRRMVLPGKLFLVERPVDLNRALWGNQGAVGKGALCAA
jgi:NifB/MoaA-like Fe-S oxidoreductase